MDECFVKFELEVVWTDKYNSKADVQGFEFRETKGIRMECLDL